ncbi:TonB-dependent receptor plug domain-containing protein [Eisenibacter elegans]|jgi:outer membrane cobalamin receptor|uniref:TonB-dependent receptor plug domain-containing protein n=1 Tax=Eisenibacter elegans TaxID=997 RepID=UPI0003FC9FDF|nr:TonB-dependent receptor plug domain-containing protein [Eisenibacter elegans]
MSAFQQWFIVYAFLWAGGTVYAQTTDSLQMYRPTVDELLQKGVGGSIEANVSVAGFQETSLRETPGIVTLITAEEIRQSGAQDLIELLRLVPGLDFAHNYENAIGLGVRGNFAEEGKFLLLLDGLTINETSFGNLTFGQRLPLQNIERIEIIRGAGSAIYGGLAALAVINIITKKAADREGVYVALNGGAAAGRLGQMSALLQTNQRYRNDLELNASVWLNQGVRSPVNTTDPTGQYTFNYADSTRIQTFHTNIGLQYKGFEARLIHNNYQYQTLFNNLTVLQQDYLLQTRYQWNPTERLFLSHTASWRQHRPWWYSNFQGLPSEQRSIYEGYKTLNNRYLANTVAAYAWSNTLTTVLGTEFFVDQATYQVPGLVFYNNEPTLYLSNIAAFAELDFRPKFANFLIGARFDKQSTVNPAFVPRVAITKALKHWHFKLLYNNAFKAPTIQNIQFSDNNNIRPERIRNLEAEVGYRLSESFAIVANIYDIQITDPIVYVIDLQTSEEFYGNIGQTGTQGLELEFRWRKNGRLGLTANYSFYQTINNTIANYAIEGMPNLLLGFPAHKITALGFYNFGKNLSINVSALYFSDKYTYLFFDTARTDFRLQPFAGGTLLNANLRHERFGLQGLTLMLGIQNALAADQWLVNANTNGYEPLPLARRGFFFQLAYELGK